MANVFDEMNPRAALVEIAHDFHRRGWMAGTAGNLSIRDTQHPDRCWITASSLPKGRLDETDFLQIGIADDQVHRRFHTTSRPSAETSIHRTIYTLFPNARACLHVHSVDACLAVANLPETATALTLPPLEMIKGLGIWEQHPVVTLPLFENVLDVPAIAEAINTRFSEKSPDVPALMIHGHGITVWGASLQEAYNRVEIVEFLMSYLARR